MQIVAIVHKYEVYNFNLSSSKLELGLALCASVSPFAVFSPLLCFFIYYNQITNESAGSEITI